MICSSRGELSTNENEGKNTWNDNLIMIDVACVVGARKGKGEEKINWARAKRVGQGRGKRLQPAHCLSDLSRSPANEKSPLGRCLFLVTFSFLEINTGQIVPIFECPILFAFYIIGKVRYKWIGVRDVQLNTEN